MASFDDCVQWALVVPQRSDPYFITSGIWIVVKMRQATRSGDTSWRWDSRFQPKRFLHENKYCKVLIIALASRESVNETHEALEITICHNTVPMSALQDLIYMTGHVLVCWAGITCPQRYNCELVAHKWQLQVMEGSLYFCTVIEKANARCSTWRSSRAGQTSSYLLSQVS